ncbi:MAG: hypothetical protein GF381_00710 [Candidatus Pacebacteria bacterium]|nr:hypothetical protein [Candidatus Paceibacterota bacterium]
MDLIEAGFGIEQLRATLSFFAVWQGTLDQREPDENGCWSEEEIGRIPHEFADPSHFRSKQFSEERKWAFPYYGAVDATLLYIISNLKFFDQLGGTNFLKDWVMAKDGQPKTMAEALLLSANWMLERMKSNPESLIESKSPNERGCLNQFWKDSLDCYCDDLGIIEPHLSRTTVEVLVMAYEAATLLIEKLLPLLLEMTDCELDQMFPNRPQLRQIDFSGLSSELANHRENLQTFLLTRLFDQERGYFGLGCKREEDGQVAILKAKASNMGWALDSSLFEPDDQEDQQIVQSIISNLFAPDMMTRWGIRTLSGSEASYDPKSYHNGSVWTMDNVRILKALLRQGYYGLAANLAQRLVSAINHVGVFPEFFVGCDEELPRWNGAAEAEESETEEGIGYYAQTLQGWTISGIVYAKNLLFKMSRGLVEPRATDLYKREFELQILKGLPGLPPIIPQPPPLPTPQPNTTPPLP